ncbi:hypothetical protein Aperf_G00000077504 [Anoplocephala perfoliata]
MAFLNPLTSKLFPHVPDFRGLAIIGKLRPTEIHPTGSLKASKSEPEGVNGLVTSSGDTLAENSVTPRGSEDLSVEEEFGGPSLLINGVLIPRLVKNENSIYEIISDPQFEICFKGSNANPVHQEICMKNNGTEDLNYRWKKVENQAFSGILPLRESCFYFYTNQGMIEAGDSKILRVSFQSPIEGVFSETWELYTEPRLLPSASPITFHFFGIIIFQSSEQREGRSKFTAEIHRQIATEMARLIVEDIVDSLFWTKPKKCLNNDALTERECFEKHNPGMKFSAEAVQALVAIQKELSEYQLKNANTGYSFSDIRQEILELSSVGQMKPGVANNLLHRLYELVENVSSSTIKNPPNPTEIRYEQW